MLIERLPGFRDFFPEPVPAKDAWSADLRGCIFNAWRQTASRYGFREYDGPPLEALDLYKLKSGDEIVGQLYNFTDKGDREVSLRPEMTPTLARMIAARERHYRKPIKWYSIPQLFRYERQQKGRLREHFQFNADLVGLREPAADAELIALLIDSLRALGLTNQDFVVRLSSRTAWEEFFRQRTGDPDRAYAFYQTIDKLDREPPEATDARLREAGFSLAEIERHIQDAPPTIELQAVLAELEARGLGSYVRLDYRVIRGLAYYTGVVFEAFDRRGEFRAIAGGGRYDNLLKLVSGGRIDLPALGFGMGDVVLTELLKARGLAPGEAKRLDVFVLVEDETLRTASLRAVQILRDAGFRVDFALTAAKSDKQFKRAVDLRAVRTLRLERGEGGDFVARGKDLQTRQEITGSVEELAREWRC